MNIFFFLLLKRALPIHVQFVQGKKLTDTEKTFNEVQVCLFTSSA